MRVYYFGVRVNWDKLLAIDQQKESFKAQIFVEATLLHPQKVRECDEKDVLKFFTRATVENSLAKPKDDEFPTQDDKKNWRFVWLIHGEFGEELELQNFPFDTQDLSVMLRFGWSLSPDQVSFLKLFISDHACSPALSACQGVAGWGSGRGLAKTARRYRCASSTLANPRCGLEGQKNKEKIPKDSKSTIDST
jgi:hypothetical protein